MSNTYPAFVPCPPTRSTLSVAFRMAVSIAVAFGLLFLIFGTAITAAAVITNVGWLILTGAWLPGNVYGFATFIAAIVTGIFTAWFALAEWRSLLASARHPYLTLRQVAI